MRRGATALATAAAAAALLLVGGCTPATPPDLVRRAAPPDPVSDPAKPCTGNVPVGPGAGSGGSVTATFDKASDTIRLTQGQNVTLAALRRAVGSDAALRQTAPGEWLLSAAIEIDQGASLTIAAPDVRWLKLLSNGPQPASVKALGGDLSITGSCVTSWDDKAQKADVDVKSPRGYVLARGGSLTVDKAQLSYLGFGDRESYGVSWREGATGHLADSTVSYNYFGVYTYKVKGISFTGSDVHDNEVYGIDPHTNSSQLKITGNTVHDNGKHGIILAQECNDSVVSGNVVYRNKQHGIVLYQDSDNNTVDNNDTFLNVAQGININGSKGNTITNNRVYDNADAGIGIAAAGEGTVVRGNDIRGNMTDGIRLVTSATATQLQSNLIGQNIRYGVYVDTKGPFTLADNTIWANKAAMVLKGETAPTQIGNSMFGNQIDGIKTE